MAINHKQWLSPIVFSNLQGYAEFKAETNDTTDVVLDCWLTEWRIKVDLVVGGSKSVMQRRKEEAKLKMT